jgi:hypothetical protein
MKYDATVWTCSVIPSMGFGKGMLCTNEWWVLSNSYVNGIYARTVYMYRVLKMQNTNTVEPRFTNLIRSWRPFVNRNVRKPKLFFP